MVQGTTSDAGKSTLVTGLCRYYARQGLKVVPFKPQNMALNSAVTIDGGEIGRAQEVQAQACYLRAHSDMNPVLLKPSSDKTAQVIIHGKVLNNQDAKAYHDYKKFAMNAVLESYQRLLQQYAVVVVEGAGSPAEINLREGDIANMGFAERVDCPVILIADIDRGGVFAHIVGTLALLSETEQRRVIGFVINRFRGDFELLRPGLEWLEQTTGKPVLGVLPYLQNFYLASEDALTVKQSLSQQQSVLNVVVLALPRMSNHTDFDPLILHPGVNLTFVREPRAVEAVDLLIIPGSKSVRDDLAWLKRQGWEAFITRHLRYQGKVIGICGGFQMLGNWVHDPDAVEGVSGSSSGLGLLDVQTTLQTRKCLRQVSGTLLLNNAQVSGYEIHMGKTVGPALVKPFARINDELEGVMSDDALVIGTYLHGLFDQAEACNALLRWAGYAEDGAVNYQEVSDQAIDLLADTLVENVDFARLDKCYAEYYQR